MIKKYWLILPVVVLFLSACVTSQPSKKNSSPRQHRQKPKVVRPIPTRAPSNEEPLKRMPSKLNELSARGCVVANMKSYLGIPPQFIAQIELTDYSNIVILHNPYSNSEGVYIRIIRNDKNSSTLELYKNNIPFVSKRWYQLLDVCK